MKKPKYPKQHKLYTSDFLRNKRSSSTKKKPPSPPSKKSSFSVLEAPQNLVISKPKDHAIFCRFLEEVERRSKEHPLTLDLSKTINFKAGAALLLYSKVSELIKEENRTIKIKKPSRQDHVRELITNCGLIEETQNHRTDNIDHLDIPIRGGDATENGHATWESVVDFILTRMGDYTTQQEAVLANAVSEAALNVSHHAYPDHKNEPTQKKWWIITDFFDGELYLAILDKGVGIHETLPRRDWFLEFLRSNGLSLDAFRDAPHSRWIELSFEKGKTSTRKEERGLGGQSIKDLVKMNNDGELHVFSGKGIYASDGTKELYKSDSKKSIGGTLIQWNIRLKR